MDEQTSKKPFIKSLNFWFGIIGIIAFIFSIYTYLYTAKPDLNCIVLTNTSVLDVKADVNKLTVTYDSINILESNMNISIILLELKNIGNKDITINEFDQNSSFGLDIVNGKLLKKPEITISSDIKYYKDVIKSYDDKSVNFNYKLIDSDKFFRIKLLVLHKKNVVPTVKAFGKISGMDSIDVTQNISKPNVPYFLYILIVCFTVIVLCLVILIFLYFKRSYIESERKSYLRNISILESENNNLQPILHKPNYVGRQFSYEELIRLKKGELVYHDRFGKGEVISIESSEHKNDFRGEFRFERGGVKKLLLRFVQLNELKSLN